MCNNNRFIIPPDKIYFLGEAAVTIKSKPTESDLLKTVNSFSQYILKLG